MSPPPMTAIIVTMIESVTRINESDAREQHAVTKTDARREDRQGEGREEEKLRLLFAHYSPQPIDTENTVGRLFFGEWGHAVNDMFMKNHIYINFLFVMSAFSWVGRSKTAFSEWDFWILTP